MAQQTLQLPVKSKTCANCAMNIERGVKKLDGVTEASVNFAAELATMSIKLPCPLISAYIPRRL